ncbi:response regulator transcription factor [Rurimicrobium arvi]|uniref:Response regulatory domain-containing protein n=1 Tax=Rurimicrobium arvi TaxID=2049916 RepID=A0ABP8MVV7_9BACT
MHNQSITLAIADDHRQIRDALESYLTQMGFKIILLADNGSTLLDLLNKAEKLPQVCIVDHQMPLLTGDKAAAIIREKYPSVRIMGMSSEKSVEKLILMLKGGCQSFLPKCSQPDEWKEGLYEIVHKGYYISDWMKQAMLKYFYEQGNVCYNSSAMAL